MIILRNNGVEKPYKVIFEGADSLTEVAAQMKFNVHDLIELLNEMYEASNEEEG